MDDKARTTADLRKTLFETMEGVLDGSVTASQATAVSKLSDNIIKTGELEIKYTAHMDQLDKSDTGIAPGPMLLTND